MLAPASCGRGPENPPSGHSGIVMSLEGWVCHCWGGVVHISCRGLFGVLRGWERLGKDLNEVETVVENQGQGSKVEGPSTTAPRLCEDRGRLSKNGWAEGRGTSEMTKRGLGGCAPDPP